MFIPYQTFNVFKLCINDLDIINGIGQSMAQWLVCWRTFVLWKSYLQFINSIVNVIFIVYVLKRSFMYQVDNLMCILIMDLYGKLFFGSVHYKTTTTIIIILLIPFFSTFFAWWYSLLAERYLGAFQLGDLILIWA